MRHTLSKAREGGRGGAGERQAGRKTPVTQEPCLSSQDANESEIEQSHYLGAQGLTSSATGFQVQSQGPTPQVLRGSGKYVAGNNDTWP